ncbi:MAG: JAB domain-containing protein [Clostridiales bacterium]|nr:JAB domain-containing protein [Clostridiales bacterium]
MYKIISELREKYTVSELREALFSHMPQTGECIRAAVDAQQILKPYAAEEQEYFLLITLSAKHTVIKLHEVTKGILNRTLIHPREIFRRAIIDNAESVIVAHNHPSGNVEPSPEDREITRRLKEAGAIMGIPLLDHIIVGSDSYYGFQENAEL